MGSEGTKFFYVGKTDQGEEEITKKKEDIEKGPVVKGGPKARVQAGRGGMDILAKSHKGGKFLEFKIPTITMKMEVPI